MNLRQLEDYIEQLNSIKQTGTTDKATKQLADVVEKLAVEVYQLSEMLKGDNK